MTFLEFLEEQKTRKKSMSFLTEAIKADDFDKVWKLILKVLNKHTNAKVGFFGWDDQTRKDGDYMSVMFAYNIGGDENSGRGMFTINYKAGPDSDVYYPTDVAFFDEKNTDIILWGSDEDTYVHSSLLFRVEGASIVYFLPIIERVIKTNDLHLTKEEASKLARGVYKESLDNNTFSKGVINFGNLKYNIFEKKSDEKTKFLENATIYNSNNSKNLVMNEAKVKSELGQRKTDVGRKYRDAHTAGDKEAAAKFNKEYREIVKAMAGGATTNAEFEVYLQNNVKVQYKSPTAALSVEQRDKLKELQDDYRNPQQAFKDMNGYLNMILKGAQRGLIVCGGPGIGKTHRVKTFLKKNDFIEGRNLCTIKGRCSARSLYLDLVNFGSEDDVIVIDDADSLVGPKAPEDCINLLKAALNGDDDEGNLVSYKIAGQLKDDEGIPVSKSTYFKGRIIIITNYSIGQIDTALRSRCFTQELNFTMKDTLDYIKTIMPAMAPRLSPESKIWAYDYLCEIVKTGLDLEVSCRSFITCTKFYEFKDINGDTMDDVKRKIRTQVRNQSLRGGVKL